MPPDGIDDILSALPLRVALSVPDDLLEAWFAPGRGMDPLSQEAVKAASDFAWRFECEFKHYPDRMEGVFWKWVPAI